jgi:L-ribulose-5-phosphate 4-epimerase
MADHAELRKAAYDANMALRDAGLAPLTWGNASAADHDADLFAIKPSGVPYDELSPERIVVVRISTGESVAGDDRPSSDTETHRRLFQASRSIGGVVHSHSTHATSFAQAMKPIPVLGTTHADLFAGDVPVARHPSTDEIASGYERASGEIIVEYFTDRGIDLMSIPAVLLPHHGPFVWGSSASQAVSNAIALEATAQMALMTLTLASDPPPIPERLKEKHYSRKHGPDAYYGQPK